MVARKFFKKFSFASFNQLRIPFDQSNVSFQLTEEKLRTDRFRQKLYDEILHCLNRY